MFHTLTLKDIKVRSTRSENVFIAMSATGYHVLYHGNLLHKHKIVDSGEAQHIADTHAAANDTKIESYIKVPLTT